MRTSGGGARTVPGAVTVTSVLRRMAPLSSGRPSTVWPWPSVGPAQWFPLRLQTELSEAMGFSGPHGQCVQAQLPRVLPAAAATMNPPLGQNPRKVGGAAVPGWPCADSPFSAPRAPVLFAKGGECPATCLGSHSRGAPEGARGSLTSLGIRCHPPPWLSRVKQTPADLRFTSSESTLLSWLSRRPLHGNRSAEGAGGRGPCWNGVWCGGCWREVPRWNGVPCGGCWRATVFGAECLLTLSQRRVPPQACMSVRGCSWLHNVLCTLESIPHSTDRHRETHGVSSGSLWGRVPWEFMEPPPPAI